MIADYDDVDAPRLRGRLEAFSDIVIGFSLAQTGAALVFPQSAFEIWTRPSALISYLITFFIISTAWLLHNRLFTYFFVPQRIPIILNFTMLCMLGLMIYGLQVFLHFGPSPAGAALYFTSLALMYGLLGALFAIGVRARNNELSVRQRAEGRRQAVRLLAISAGAAIGVAVGFLIFPNRFVETAAICVGVAAAIQRVATRLGSVEA